MTHPLQFVQDRVLAFLLPMIEEHVLEQLGEFGVGLDALAIVELREQLDVESQRQHGPGTLAEHRMGNRIGVDVEAIAFGQNVTDHRVYAAEQRLVLQFLVAESDQRLESNLVTEPVIMAQLQDLGIDETLNQTKNIGVGAALDLAHEPPFSSRQSRERISERKAVGQKFLRHTETPPSDDILVDVPADALGGFNATRIPVGGRDIMYRVHDALPSNVSGVPAIRTTGR